MDSPPITFAQLIAVTVAGATLPIIVSRLFDWRDRKKVSDAIAAKVVHDAEIAEAVKKVLDETVRTVEAKVVTAAKVAGEKIEEIHKLANSGMQALKVENARLLAENKALVAK